LGSGVVMSRSSVPDERSRSVAIEVTRNMSRNGKIPSSFGATSEKTSFASRT
jgi:hypothetical protein